MGEIERIADQLVRAHEGGAWHGPSLSEILSGVEPESAWAKPIPGAHSIRELVDHVATWERVVVERIERWEAVEPTDEENYPAPGEPSAEAWRSALDALDRGYRRLLETIRRFPENRLGEIVPGKPYTVYVMLHGVVQHGLYHAGQMAILKRGV
jgi:uncharacterized damage-inducible protein DinB